MNKKLDAWIKEMVDLCKPDKVYWCDGSEEENNRLLKEMVDSGMATELPKRPGSYFPSDPSDVARVGRTYIASKRKMQAQQTIGLI